MCHFWSFFIDQKKTAMRHRENISKILSKDCNFYAFRTRPNSILNDVNKDNIQCLSVHNLISMSWFPRRLWCQSFKALVLPTSEFFLGQMGTFWWKGLKLHKQIDLGLKTWSGIFKHHCIEFKSITWALSTGSSRYQEQMKRFSD